MIVPEAFAAVLRSATELYSGLSEASAGPLAPVGYHEWPGGARASDGYRVHLRGRMPSFGWVELLHSEADDWDFGDWRVGRGLIEWLESVAEVSRETPIFFEESGLTTDMLDGPWADGVDTYWPECPLVVEGFGTPITSAGEAASLGSAVGRAPRCWRRDLLLIDRQR